MCPLIAWDPKKFCDIENGHFGINFGWIKKSSCEKQMYKEQKKKLYKDLIENVSEKARKRKRERRECESVNEKEMTARV